MGPEDVFEYAKKLREAGIEEVALNADGDRVLRVKLAAHWSPPEQPEPVPVFDADPVADSIARAKWAEGKRILKEMEAAAREDRIRFAHTEGT